MSDAHELESIWKSMDWDDESRRRTAEVERLRQRAQQYAAPVSDSDMPSEDSLTLVTFDLGMETYGLDVMAVRGVRESPRIVRVPGVPDFYPGVINVRGQIVTVLDLRRFFNMDSSDEVMTPEEVIIIQTRKLRLGLLAHRINGVETVNTNQIVPLEHLPYAQGVTPNRLIVLNVSQILTDERLIVGESV